MADPYLALITPLTGSPPQIWPGPHPSHPIVLPGAPPGTPGSPSHPIYVPGYPDQGLPPYPDQGLPPSVGVWPGPSPSHPIALPPGGTPVPPEVWPNPPTPPGDYASQIIVAVYRPGEEWEVKAYPVAPSHPIPPAVSHPISPPTGPAPSPRR